MTLFRFFLYSLPLLFACSSNPPASDSPSPSDASSCPAPPDLASTSPMCAAAKGLPGEPLLCLDFKDVSSTSMLQGWDFNLCTVGWTIAGGKLQVNNFKDFADVCSFRLPPLPPADFQKFSAFSLAVLHKVDLNSNQQKALIMLGGDDEQKRLLDWKTGPQPRLTNVYSIAKADLPLVAQSAFQPVFKLSSGIASGLAFAGWQIESIAILGLP